MSSPLLSSLRDKGLPDLGFLLLRINMNPSFLLLLLLCGCASIETKTSLSQRVGEELSAGVGDAVIRLNSEKNLPNVFGKSDVFGRTTPTGITTVVYAGVFGGKARFIRQDVDIETGATTMNSTPMVIPTTSVTTYSGSYAGRPYSGSAVTSGTPVVIPANTPQATLLERPAVQIEVDVSKLPQLILVQGYQVKVLSADPGVVRYLILTQ
jgi:hypothetical protein